MRYFLNLLFLVSVLPALSAQTDLIPNNDFSQGLKSWWKTPREGVGVSVEREEGASRKVLRIAPDGQNLGVNSMRLYLGRDIFAEQSYRASCLVKAISIESGTFVPSLTFYKKDGSYAAQYYFPRFAAGEQKAGWRKLEYMFGAGTAHPIPADAESLCLRFSFWDASGVCRGDVRVAEPSLFPIHIDPERLRATNHVDGGEITARGEQLDGKRFYWIEAEDMVPPEAYNGAWAYRRSWTWQQIPLPNGSRNRGLVRPAERNVASVTATVAGIESGRYNLFLRMGAFKPWGSQHLTLSVNGRDYPLSPVPTAVLVNRAYTWVKVNADAPLELGDTLRLSVSNETNPREQSILDCFLLTDDLSYTPPEKFPARGYYSVHPYEGPGVTAEFWCPSVLDTPVYLCQDSSQQFLLNIRNLTGKPQDNFDLVLTLPKGVTLMDPSRAQRWAGNDGKWAHPHFIDPAPESMSREDAEDAQGGTRYVLRYRSPFPVFDPYQKSNTLFFVVLTTDGSLPPGRYPVTLETRDVSQIWQGGIRRQTLEILPPLRGRRVSGYNWGVDAIYASFLNPGEQAALVKTFASAGINVWASRVRGGDPDLSLRNQSHWKIVQQVPGMRLVDWGEFWWPGTPYSDESRDYVEAHPESAGSAVLDDRGTSLRGKLICPEYLLHGEGESYIREHLEKSVGVLREHGITEVIEDVEYSSPLSYCFDERCKRRFAEMKQLPWSEIDPLSGAEIIARYREAWVDFRSRQNAEIVDKISRTARALYPEINYNLFCGYQSWGVRQRYGVDWPLLLKAPEVNGVYVGGGLPGTAKQIEQMQEWTAASGKNFISMANATLSFVNGFDELSTRNQAYLEARVIHDFLCGSRGLFIWWWGTLDGRCLKAFEMGTQLAERYGSLIAKGEHSSETVGTTDDFQFIKVRAAEGTLIGLVNPAKVSEDLVVDPETLMREFPPHARILDARTGAPVARDGIRQRLDRVFRKGDAELWFIPSQNGGKP